ncbi:MAG TPA: hypothetical protein V6D18_00530 [Thermosynechococcaceae cyanobacterium]
MPQAILNQILEQLQTLEPAELQQLNQAVQNRLENLQPANHANFYSDLLTSGLIRQIKSPSSQQPSRSLIEVQGEPVSRTIIEERR